MPWIWCNSSRNTICTPSMISKNWHKDMAVAWHPKSNNLKYINYMAYHFLYLSCQKSKLGVTYITVQSRRTFPWHFSYVISEVFGLTTRALVTEIENNNTPHLFEFVFSVFISDATFVMIEIPLVRLWQRARFRGIRSFIISTSSTQSSISHQISEGVAKS